MASALSIIGYILLAIVAIVVLGILGILGWIVKGTGSIFGFLFEGMGEGLGCILRVIFYIFFIGIAIAMIL